jgi:carboxymethylenebutenolidase
VCFEHESSPPIPVLRGAAVSHDDDLILEARDGNRFAAFGAYPDQPTGIGIAILPDVRGLYRFYEELALRFAERGYTAVAFDYFGRSAGVGKRDEAFDYVEHVRETTAEGLQTDVAAAVAHLRETCSVVFTVGFCFGGRHSWLAAAGGHDLYGAIGFYGRPGPGQDGSPGPAERAGEMRAPILGLMGGADPAIPPDDVAMFERALEENGVEHEVVTYPGAPHSFFDRKQAEFADVSEDAWQRVLAFVKRHSLPR